MKTGSWKMHHNPCFTVSATSMQSTIAKYVIRVYTLDRKVQKTFVTRPQLAVALEKANQFGLTGTKLLLADDGCEICDDETFLYYIEQSAKFMVVDSASQWTKPLL